MVVGRLIMGRLGGGDTVRQSPQIMLSMVFLGHMTNPRYLCRFTWVLGSGMSGKGRHTTPHYG